MYHASLENILLEQFRWTISAANNQINWLEPDPRSHLTLEVAGAEEEEEVREDAECMLAPARLFTTLVMMRTVMRLCLMMRGASPCDKDRSVSDAREHCTSVQAVLLNFLCV